jgi:CheY-like chemotaxis protein
MAVILVVDDEPDVRELAAVVLADAGHAVLTAKDGAEAIDLVDRNPPARPLPPAPDADQASRVLISASSCEGR